MKYDIAIIGGGPAGYNAAEKAASNGFKTILFEKSAVGGVCLNEGCIPTKTFLYSAKLLDGMKGAGKYGLQIGDFSIDHKKVVQRKNKIVKKLTAGVKYKLNLNGVEIINQPAVIKGEVDGNISIEAGGELYQVEHLLLCTGSDTAIPPIKGLDGVEYWTSKEALEATELPAKLVIIGGGVIGMEFASYFNSVGVDVTVVEMMPEILGAMDKEISAMLRAEYSKKGVKFHLNTAVVEVAQDKVIIEKEGKREELPTDKILVSVGRRANVANIGLETLGIETERKGVKVNQFMQTNHPRVYAAGDITGFSMLAHTAIREGEVAINHILGRDDEMSYRGIPGVVYTNPEIAGVGKTEEELIASGEDFRVSKLPMTYSGRFMAENEGVNGLCKLITNSEGYIIGCHMMGNPASELIVLAGTAIDLNITVEQFQKIVFPHPTVSEILREVAFE